MAIAATAVRKPDVKEFRFTWVGTDRASMRPEKRRSTRRPLIMVVLGTLIGGLVVAMYLPIFKMGQAV